MKARGLIIAIVIGALLLLVLNLPLALTRPIRIGAREMLAPYQSGITRLMQGARDFVGVLGNWRSIAGERDSLKGEIALLNNEINRLELQARENTELRQWLEYAREQRRPMVVADVIARDDSGGWWRTIRLNQGSSRRLAPGQAVITPDGLVGITTNVTPRTCDVLLISDTDCKVGVRLVQAGVFGILRGGGGSLLGAPVLDILLPLERLAVDYLDKNIELNAGDKVVTSGRGGNCPPEIAVGVVTKVYADPSGLYQHCEVVPSADLLRLHRVFVVLPPEPEKPAAKKTDAAKPPANKAAPGKAAPPKTPKRGRT